jgi:hypothetical protein
MTNQEKKEEIKLIVSGMIECSKEQLYKSLDKALNSGCIDIDNWNDKINPLELCKSLMIAILENEASTYYAWSTCFEKEVKREVKNIKLFL